MLLNSNDSESNAQDSESVSYTHLDVYKRQIMLSANFIFLLISVFNNFIFKMFFSIQFNCQQWYFLKMCIRDRLAALVIIPAMATTGAQLDQGGPGLLFIFLPHLIRSMPGGWLIAILFLSIFLHIWIRRMINDPISASVEAIADPAIPNFKVNINR